MLTVRALLRWPPLAGAEVVAGEAGLDREVTWPAMLRVRPPAFEPLSGGELALVSIEMLHLLDESLSLAQLVGRLAGRGVAGVVVIGPADSSARARADHAVLPLLELPETFPFAELGPAVSRVIAEERTRIYQLGLDVQYRLAEVSMAGRGLAGIIQTVADLAGQRAVLQDANGVVIVRATPVDRARLVVASALPEVDSLRGRFDQRRNPRGETPTARLSTADGLALVAPVVVREAVVGYLGLLGEAFSDEAQVALTRGVQVCALEMAKQEAVTEAERRLRGGFFDDLLGDGPSTESPEALLERASRLGHDLRKDYVVLAVTPIGLLPASDRFAAMIEQLARAMSDYLASRREAGLVAARRSAVAVLLAIPSGGDLEPARSFAEALREHLEASIEGTVSIGLGAFHPGIAGLRQSFREAEQAGQIGTEFFGPARVTAYSDLGAYRLLYAFRGSAELAAFCQETLGALLRYDEKNGAELITTLEAFFRHDASLRAAADALCLHRNSLAYRLRRIAEITGFDLDRLEDRFRLQLALKGLRLIQRPAAPSP